eukprot:scaffold143_cov364-Pavlova_lutheri.AAC.20
MSTPTRERWWRPLQTRNQGKKGKVRQKTTVPSSARVARRPHPKLRKADRCKTTRKRAHIPRVLLFLKISRYEVQVQLQKRGRPTFVQPSRSQCSSQQRGRPLLGATSAP